MSHPVKFSFAEPAKQHFNEEKKDDDEDVTLVDTLDALQGKLVSLTLAPGDQVVAFGIVVSTVVENQTTTCVLVAIDTVIDGSAQLPISTGELLCIADAVGSQVPWPAHLIRMKPQETKRSVGSLKKEPKEPTLHPSSMPGALYMVYFYCKSALQDGSGIAVQLANDVFGSKCMIFVYLDDVMPFCQLQPITTNCIVVYIWHLFRKMKNELNGDRFRFVNPHTLGLMSRFGQDKKGANEVMEEKSRLLADLLKGTAIGQLVFVPVNVGFQWILMVINPYIENVYLLDPLSHRNRYDDWKMIVNLAIKLFNVDQKKSGRK